MNEQRLEKFEKEAHVRIFGLDLFKRLEKAGFRLKTMIYLVKTSARDLASIIEKIVFLLIKNKEVDEYD